MVSEGEYLRREAEMDKRTLLHPEKVLRRGNAHTNFLKTLWAKELSEHDVSTVQGFGIAMQRYTEGVERYRRIFKPEPIDVLQAMTPAELDKSNAQVYLTINVEHLRVVVEVLFELLDAPTYSVMCLDKRIQALQQYEMSMLRESTGRSISYEELSTEWIMLHAAIAFQATGSRVYEVAPTLRLLLENTHLRGLPTDQLKLPHQVIYLTLPPDYDVYNERTGMHTSEGVYVVEDTERIPRTWRLILVGGPNEQSVTKDDDALYHWTVTLPETGTVEDAIQESVELVEEVRTGGSAIREVEVRGEMITVEAGNPEAAKAQVAHFDFMQDTLVKLFRYVMNTVLYATHPDADVTFRDANSDYNKLQKRLHRLPKNTHRRKSKRKHIRKQLKGLAKHKQPRITLGRTVIIDRNLKQTLLEEAGPGANKHSVRYIVSGHWHMYWTGKGRKTATKKWVKPYYKGLEHAPLTQGKTRLK